jgi:hypothetical protein
MTSRYSASLISLSSISIFPRERRYAIIAKKGMKMQRMILQTSTRLWVDTFLLQKKKPTDMKRNAAIIRTQTESAERISLVES